MRLGHLKSTAEASVYSLDWGKFFLFSLVGQLQSVSAYKSIACFLGDVFAGVRYTYFHAHMIDNNNNPVINTRIEPLPIVDPNDALQ